MKPANVTLAQSLRAYAPVWAVLGLGLTVSGLAAVWLSSEAHRTDEKRFAGLVEQTRQTFDNITEKYQRGLQALADTIGAREDFTEKHWDLQMNRLSADIDYPGLVEVRLIRIALATNLPPELEDVTADDFRSPRREQRQLFLDANALVKRSPLRLEPLWNYIPRGATEPHAQGAPGDALDDELQCITRAVRAQATTMTGRRVVLRHKKGGVVQGSTMILPIPGETLAQAWSTNISAYLQSGRLKDSTTIKGFVGKRYTSAIVCGSIDWSALIHFLLSHQRPELHLDLYATRTPSEDQWLGGSGSTPLSPTSAGTANFRTNFPVNMYSLKWTLAMSTTPLFADQSTDYRAYVALFGGSVVTVLMAALLAGQIRARVRQQIITGELREALAALEAARTEREQVGRDLHDGAIQSLYALQLGLSRTAGQARAAVPEVGERLAEYRRAVSAIVGELRHFILRHEAEAQPGADLCRVISASLERLRSTTSAKLGTELDANAAARLSNEQAVHLANIAREALSNSLRHAAARYIQVALGAENGSVKLEVRDDGCGFDPTGLPPGGMGLANMTARAKEAGGELKVDTAPGRGTCVTVKVAAMKSASA